MERSLVTIVPAGRFGHFAETVPPRFQNAGNPAGGLRNLISDPKFVFSFREIGP